PASRAPRGRAAVPRDVAQGGHLRSARRETPHRALWQRAGGRRGAVGAPAAAGDGAEGGLWAAGRRSAGGRRMILEQLTVRNFCLYRGEQAFDLTPVTAGGRHRPIVLFGGINGGGKTTLLDAIQLALYGNRSRCSKRADLSYEEFLRASTHHGTPE